MGDQPGDGAEEGGLSRPVRADQCDPSPRGNLGAQTLEHPCAVVRDRHSNERDRSHGNLLALRRTRRKKGAPKNAVITPIGTSAGDVAVLARKSAKTRKAPPNMTERGRIRR